MKYRFLYFIGFYFIMFIPILMSLRPRLLLHCKKWVSAHRVGTIDLRIPGVRSVCNNRSIHGVANLQNNRITSEVLPFIVILFMLSNCL